MMTFLSAEWRNLILLNYTVDPDLLLPLVPAGTELDFHEGRTLVSVVGFQFLHTRVLGIPVPFHINFDEVNLRFYVRRKAPEGWRRGVVFVREIVPRLAIAAAARLCYGEPYVSLPMRHEFGSEGTTRTLKYGWKLRGRWNFLGATVSGAPTEISTGSEEEFILEHYWGYTASGGKSHEYKVEHPHWRVWTGALGELDCDIEANYGAKFLKPLSAEPVSCIVAEGSPVLVKIGRKIA